MYKIESYKYNTSNFYLFVSNSNVRTRNASLKAFARCTETFKNEKNKQKRKKRVEEKNIGRIEKQICEIILKKVFIDIN